MDGIPSVYTSYHIYFYNKHIKKLSKLKFMQNMYQDQENLFHTVQHWNAIQVTKSKGQKEPKFLPVKLHLAITFIHPHKYLPTSSLTFAVQQIIMVHCLVHFRLCI